MFHKYHLLNQFANFHEIQKITKRGFNIPLREGTPLIRPLYHCRRGWHYERGNIVVEYMSYL